MNDLIGIFFVWDSRAMLNLRPQSQSTPTWSHTTPLPKSVPEIEDEVQFIDPDDYNDKQGVHFIHKKFERSTYNFVTVTANISQIRDFEHPLRPIDEAHCNELKNIFMDPEIGFQTASGLMSITILN